MGGGGQREGAADIGIEDDGEWGEVEEEKEK